jgi:hypothetical protein
VNKNTNDIAKTLVIIMRRLTNVSFEDGSSITANRILIIM